MILNNARVYFLLRLDWSFGFAKIGTNSSTSFKIAGATLNSVSSFDQYWVLNATTTACDGDWFGSKVKNDDVFDLFYRGLYC